MKKKLLAILLTLAMVVTMIPAVFVTVTAEAAFVPKDDAWFAEHGYTAITDVAGLKAITMGTASDAIAKYYLKNDIVVPNDTPDVLIAAVSKYIELDGNGHTISNINRVRSTGSGYVKTGGLVDRAGGYTTIKNLTIKGSVQTTVSGTGVNDELGLLFGGASGIITLENVHGVGVNVPNSETINVSSADATAYVGGLIGSVTSTSANNGWSVTGTESATVFTVTNCSFSGSIETSGNYIGGLFGALVNSKVVAENLVNNADVTEKTPAKEDKNAIWPRVGGIVGTLSGTGDLALTNLVNYGDISGRNDNGGIIGQSNVTDTTLGDGQYTVKGLVNYGVVTGKNADGNPSGNAAGLVFVVDGGRIKIADGANYGTMKANSVASGLLGAPKNSATVTMVDCVNFATVTHQGGTPRSNHVAGLVGVAQAGASNTTVENCFNFGTITTLLNGWTRISGMLGGTDDSKFTGTVAFTNCGSFGKMVGTGDTDLGNLMISDFVGSYGSGTSITFTKCFGANNFVHEGSAEITSAYMNLVYGRHPAEKPPVFVNCVSANNLHGEDNFYNGKETSVQGVTVIANLDGVEAAATALGSAFVYDDGRIEPKYSLNTVPTQVFATQEHDADKNDDIVDVRVLALVNSLGYDKAGVNLYAVGSNEAGIVRETKIVYSGVIDGTETLYAPYGTYYLPITVKNISNNGTYSFVVETFVQNNGEDAQVSDKYTITITDGVVVDAKKN